MDGSRRHHHREPAGHELSGAGLGRSRAPACVGAIFSQRVEVQIELGQLRLSLLKLRAPHWWSPPDAGIAPHAERAISITICRSWPQFDLNFYALAKRWRYAGAALWSARVRAGKLVPGPVHGE